MNEKEFMTHVRKEIIDLVNEHKIITIENEPKRMNSYEHNYLMSYWSNKLLLKNVKYYIEQAFSEFRKTSFKQVEISYNEVLKHKLIHMLIERLNEKENELSKSCEECDHFISKKCPPFIYLHSPFGCSSFKGDDKSEKR